MGWEAIPVNPGGQGYLRLILIHLVAAQHLAIRACGVSWCPPIFLMKERSVKRELLHRYEPGLFASSSRASEHSSY